MKNFNIYLGAYAHGLNYPNNGDGPEDSRYGGRLRAEAFLLSNAEPCTAQVPGAIRPPVAARRGFAKPRASR